MPDERGPAVPTTGPRGQEPLTVFTALDVSEPVYRRFTAVHESGHAVAALATGQARVLECAVDGEGERAYTDVRWDSQQALLVLLHGGHLAQQRWLREQHMWTALRSSAVRAAASHDFDALAATGATPGEVRQASDQAEEFLDRHWTAVMTVAEHLHQHGRLTGAEVQTLFTGTPTNAAVAARLLTLDEGHLTRLEALATARENRARPRGTAHQPPLTPPAAPRPFLAP
ncbi:hypothetical protein OIE69_44505 (plasmid) [Actinacidiphila glaucinigra]|uniref:hypothetical protein n=1 Tax=Actinacidiphila glaucinigra TaxID=235986 RepID=UPI002DDAF074|nr:hypothetical protein [Actinacidiphila glaucinigra]WSD65745.1 hypothetical protein OIE69_43345 [Actinacidiphila glaucinigra]WSD65967.1 hypothetical protein OIE69_44505 [Actinacidiphila glaucinigra]